MGATVAPISKKLGANPIRWGPLAPWPPLISIAGYNAIFCCEIIIGPVAISASVAVPKEVLTKAPKMHVIFSLVLVHVADCP